MKNLDPIRKANLVRIILIALAVLLALFVYFLVLPRYMQASCGFIVPLI
jgi:hypothetical protein